MSQFHHLAGGHRETVAPAVSHFQGPGPEQLRKCSAIAGTFSRLAKKV